MWHLLGGDPDLQAINMVGRWKDQLDARNVGWGAAFLKDNLETRKPGWTGKRVS